MVTPSATPRVLHVVRSLETGGLERVVCELTIARGVERASVACLCARGPFANTIDEAGGTVHVISEAPTSMLVRLYRLIRVVRQVRPDVIHCHNLYAHLLGSLAALACGIIPTVFTKHGPFLPGSSIGQAVQRLLSRRTAVIAVSNEILEIMQDWNPSGYAHLSYIPNGVAVPHLAGESVRSQTRQELGLQPGSWVFTSVSRIVKGKGLECLLRAFDQVRRANPNAELMIVGDGPLLTELKRSAAALQLGQQVHFLGERRDVGRLLTASDTFVLASEFEGLPMAVLEAMASSLPVIATHVGEIPRVVLAGRTGVLVPPKSDEELASAMLEVSVNPALARQMGSAGRARVERDFSLAACVQKYESVYAAMSAGRRGSRRAGPRRLTSWRRDA